MSSKELFVKDLSVAAKKECAIGPVIYNDGEIVVHYIGDGDVGSIQRVHNIGERVVEQASKEEFLRDLPVNHDFLSEIKEDAESWAHVQQDIAVALKPRGHSWSKP